jgi:hypothetical protein
VDGWIIEGEMIESSFNTPTNRGGFGNGDHSTTDCVHSLLRCVEAEPSPSLSSTLLRVLLLSSMTTMVSFLLSLLLCGLIFFGFDCLTGGIPILG